ncbi:MAG TPA: NlpC/P60 family protein [Acidimicrobiia bacterium]|jgi:cell wall-associated NlpC family hydrolase
MLSLITMALAFVTVGSVMGPVASAPASPLDDKQSEAASLEQQINANGIRIDALNEQINSAQIQLDQANATIAQADAQVAAAKAKARALRGQLAARAASVYRQAGTTGVADLDAQSASDLATREKYTSLAADREHQLVAQLASAREDLAARKASAEDARAAAANTEQQIQSSKDELVAGDKKQRDLLSQVKGDIAVLVAQQEADRVARETAAAQARMAATPATSTGTGGGSVNRGDADTTPRAVPAPSGGAATAIAYAQAQLGKPYCYAGVGPECYDCSGLTMMAWGQAGVGMPHGSTEQYNMFPHVPLSQAQPGDLIVWDGHVGLYIGGGMMIHAPHTGTVVQVAPIYGTPWGAARPG